MTPISHKVSLATVEVPAGEGPLTVRFRFAAKPKVKAITVVPLWTIPDLGCFDVPIANIAQHIQHREGVDEATWVGTASSVPVSRLRYATSKDAFYNAVAIWPSVRYARLVQTSNLKRSMLPFGVPVKTVAAAIDIDGNGSPDLVLVRRGIDPGGSGSWGGSAEYHYERRIGRWTRVRNERVSD